jgi:hypothetical protein
MRTRRSNRSALSLALLMWVAVVAHAVPARAVDADDRTAVRDAYENTYLPLVDSLTFDSSPWTGSVVGCVQGTLPTSVRDDMLGLVNFYRSLAELGPVTRAEDLDDMSQAAALVMDANNALSHTPPSDWDCWTQAAYDGAYNSNLHFSSFHDEAFLARSIDSLMFDLGTNNTPVGHRRWILWPAPRPIGFGATPESMAMWVTGDYPADGNAGAPEYIEWRAPDSSRSNWPRHVGLSLTPSSSMQTCRRRMS